MKNLSIAAALLFGFAAPSVVQAEKIRVNLVGYQEVPAVSTEAVGHFEATINKDETAIDWELTYSGFSITGGRTVTQAHIHFGQRSVTGGISIWLCGNIGTTPAGIQACPLEGGTISGTSTAANVVGPAGQRIAPGELAEIIAAIRAGVAYANVHSTVVGTGEIRGQLHRHHRGHHNGHHNGDHDD